MNDAMGQPIANIAILLLVLGFSIVHFYFGIFRPDFWIRFIHIFNGNRSDDRFLLSNETFQMKCKLAGVAGLLGVLVSIYGIVLNVQKLI